MSNELTIFDFRGHDVRTLTIDGSPWWIAKDVCEVLEIEKHRDAVARLDSDERESVIVDTLGGKQHTTAINESGLYSLILRSRKPEAKAFKKWITSEVLPALRKQGFYSTRPQDEILTRILDRMDAQDRLIAGIVQMLTEKRTPKLKSEPQPGPTFVLPQTPQGRAPGNYVVSELLEQAELKEMPQTITVAGSPVKEIRRKVGMSRARFALVMNLGEEAVRNAERGITKRLQAKYWQDGLTRLGYDFEAIAALYQKWRDDWKVGNHRVIPFRQAED